VAARPQGSRLDKDGRLATLPETLSSHHEYKSQTEDVTGPGNCMQFQRNLSSNSRGSRVASFRHTNHQSNFSGNGSVDSSPLSASFREPQWLSSPLLPDHDGNSVNTPSDSVLSPYITEASSKEEYPSAVPYFNPKTPESFTPSLNTEDCFQREYKSQPDLPQCSKSQLASSRRPSIRSRSFFSRRLHHTSNKHLTRQISDSRIHALNSLNSSSISALDGRHSFKLAGSNGDSTVGSHGGVPDWWSMQTFSDLVASSRRERFRWSDATSPSDFGWIPGRESMDGASLAMERIRAKNAHAASTSSQVEVQTCGICSKLLSQEYHLSVVAVLACGHVYHPECLEKTTSEANQQDPSCPLCIASEEMLSKRLPSPVERIIRSKGGGLRAYRSQSQSSTRNKMSRIGVANDDIVDPQFFSGEILLSCKDRLSIDNVVKLSSSKIEKDSFNKSLFRRHFSLRGKSKEEHTTVEAGCKLSGTSRHSGESSTGNDFSLQHAKHSGSFRYFRKWVHE